MDDFSRENKYIRFYRGESDAMRWKEGLPSAPLIIPICFFGALILTLILLLIKFLRRYYDKKYRSKYYYVHRGFEDDKQKLKRSQEDNEADSPQLNSMIITNDQSNEDNSIDVVNNLMQVDGGPSGEPTAPDEDVISNQQTLERKKAKASESSV